LAFSLSLPPYTEKSRELSLSAQLVDKLIDKLSGFEKGSVGFREKGT